jgi:MazG family protein
MEPETSSHRSRNRVDALLEIMARLRKECPWDARQTHETLRRYLLEESYEVLEAIDDGRPDKLASELGDLLLQIVFHSEIASERNRFDFHDVVDLISKKLVERHPHVFGDTRVHSAGEVQKNWEESKVIKEKRESLLSGIPRSTPALLQAQRLQSKAATVGFEWDDVTAVFEKMKEEMHELQAEIEAGDKDHMEKELGDLLFTIVNMCRYYNISAEDALRKTNSKFTRRFRYIEKQYKHSPKAMKEASLEELDALWEEAKKLKKDE